MTHLSSGAHYGTIWEFNRSWNLRGYPLRVKDFGVQQNLMPLGDDPISEPEFGPTA